MASSAEGVLQKIKTDLQAEDEASQIIALGALSVLTASTMETNFVSSSLLTDIKSLLSDVLYLLQSSTSSGLKENAAAALGFMFEITDKVPSKTATVLTDQLRTALQSATTATTTSSLPPSLQLLHNLGGAIASLAESSEANRKRLIETDAPALLIQSLKTFPVTNELCAGAMDAVCRVMANVEDSRVVIIKSGGIEAVAKCMVYSLCGSDLCIRSLMGLAMMVDNKEDKLRVLAAERGAVGAVVRLMSQQEDIDCQHIALSFYVMMMKVEGLKDQVEGELKALQEGGK
jgi:hypothetical protein